MDRGMGPAKKTIDHVGHLRKLRVTIVIPPAPREERIRLSVVEHGLRPLICENGLRGPLEIVTILNTTVTNANVPFDTICIQIVSDVEQSRIPVNRVSIDQNPAVGLSKGRVIDRAHVDLASGNNRQRREVDETVRMTLLESGIRSPHHRTSEGRVVPGEVADHGRVILCNEMRQVNEAKEDLAGGGDERVAVEHNLLRREVAELVLHTRHLHVRAVLYLHRRDRNVSVENTTVTP